MDIIQLRIGKEDYNHCWAIAVAILGVGIRVSRAPRRAIPAQTWGMDVVIDWPGYQWYWSSRLSRRVL